MNNIDPTCYLCAKPLGKNTDCQNCTKYNKAMDAFRTPSAAHTYVHMLNGPVRSKEDVLMARNILPCSDVRKNSDLDNAKRHTYSPIVKGKMPIILA